MPEGHYPWVGLRFELTSDDVVRVRWRDERSTAWSPAAPQRSTEVELPLPPEVAGMARAVVFPRAVRGVLGRTWTPSPLAVFLDAPLPYRGLPLEAFAAPIVADARAQAAVQVVRWARRHPTPRRPFRLPMRVATVGDETRDLADRLLSSAWYATEGVAEFGFHLEHLDRDQAAKRLLDEARPIDVVVTADDALSRILRAAGRAVPPRLVVALLESPSPRPAWLSRAPIPARTSVAWFGEGPRRGVALAESLIYALTHDLPLHAAVRDAASWNDMPLDSVGLVSDPVANQSLRISEAMTSMLARADTLTFRFDPGEVGQFFTRLSEREMLTIEEPLRAASHSAAPLHDAAGMTRHLAVTFERETSGLVPIAQHQARLEYAARDRDKMVVALAEVAQDPEKARIVQDHQRRTVDIAVQRAGPPSATGVSPAGPLFLTGDTVLRAGDDYCMRVHAGTPEEQSIVRGKRPALDPLLPDPPDARGHLLEFVVFGHDFEVLSETRQERYLPLLGGTEPAYFDLRAPGGAHDWELSPKPVSARARVAVFYRGNLLQSFLLHALVGHEEAREEDGALRAELEFSQSERLANLDQVGRRELSIAVNESPDGSHFLMLRGTGLDGDVRLTEAQIDDPTKEFRKTLLDATFSDLATETQRFALGEAPDWDEFDRCLRKLARDGRALFQAVYLSAPGRLRPLLEGVGKSTDEVLQVTLHNAGFAFPWAALYDRRPPDEDADVCYGGVSRDEFERGAPLEFRCGHGYGDEVFCVYGFWGVRQQLEYLLPGGADPVPELKPKPGGGRVCLAIGDIDAFTQVLVDELKADLGDSAVRVMDKEDPLDLLWSDERPVEVVLIGHLDIPKDTPNDPRIVFLGNGKVLRNDEVFSRVQAAAWEDPNSLVLLMACGSAADDLRSLVTMLRTFAAAPAAAVVGTETPVVESLVSHFASKLSLAMWRDHKSLGEALTSVRRAMIASGNPLGFGFSAYGNADLRIAA